jgi:hypothetical protein
VPVRLKGAGKGTGSYEVSNKLNYFAPHLKIK